MSHMPSRSTDLQATSPRTTDIWLVTHFLSRDHQSLPPFENGATLEEYCPKPFQFKTICQPHGIRLELQISLVERTLTSIFVILKISFTCIRFVPDTELNLDGEINSTYFLTLKDMQLRRKQGIFKGSEKCRKINSAKMLEKK